MIDLTRLTRSDFKSRSLTRRQSLQLSQGASCGPKACDEEEGGIRYGREEEGREEEGREEEGREEEGREEEVGEDQGQLIALKFGANKSLRYHSARRSFFDAMHRTGMAVAAIGGSAAFVALIGGETLFAKIAAAIIAVAATLDVVVGFSERARHHDDIYRRWSDLVAKMLRHGPPEEQVLRDWNAERTLIEKEEPTSIWATMISDLDIFRTASVLVKRHGEDAPVENAQRTTRIFKSTKFGKRAPQPFRQRAPALPWTIASTYLWGSAEKLSGRHFDHLRTGLCTTRVGVS